MRWSLSNLSSSSSSSSFVKEKHFLREMPRQEQEKEQNPQKKLPIYERLKKNKKKKTNAAHKIKSFSRDNILLSSGESNVVAHEHGGIVDEGTSTSESVNHHMIFSTDCSPYQRWQSYLLFFHAYRVKQPGKVTRIASGCDDKEAKDELEWHTKYVSEQISQDYSIHLTPHFSSVKDESGNDTGKDYKFYNKPFGVRHWMEHNPDMGFHTETEPNTDTKTRDDTIVILIDPDMILTRPITRDFPLDPTQNIAVRTADADYVRPGRVTHGKPFAQLFGFGAAWTDLDIPTITGDPSTPAAKVTRQTARDHYPVGPPYLATAVDMHRIVMKWAEYVPKVYAEHPHLMAEMYAFCIAAAHLELPHQVMNSMMISDKMIGTEGWSLFENDVGEGEMCGYAMKRAKAEVVMAGEKTLPNVLHYCQIYLLGKWFFGKWRFPKDFFSCHQPLLMTPPDNLDTLYDYFIPPPSGGRPNGGPSKPMTNRKHIQRTAFMICYLTQAMNEASISYKEKNCDNTSNLDKTMDLWKE